jgi:serine protease Do
MNENKHEELLKMDRKKWIRYSILLIIAGIIIGLGIASELDLTQDSKAQASPISESSPVSPPNQADKSSIEILESISNAFADVAETVNPSVVTISTKTIIKNRQVNPFNDFFGDDFFRRFFNSPGGPQGEYVQQGLGSGVIVGQEGVILTNDHVVEDANDIYVRLMDGREFEASVQGKDSNTDLAVIKIDANDLPAIRIGDSDALRVGQWVLAIGSPLQPELAHSVTSGIVSAKGRSGVGGLSTYQDYIQTDAAINPGNSGGPLVNLKGELVGINTAIATRTGGNMGIGFAIPSKLAEKVMTDIMVKGRVVRGWLGVGIQNVSAELAKNFNLDKPEGVIVTEVMSDGPAERAGFKVEDIILELNGERIKNVTHLSTRIGSTDPGAKINIKVLRNGNEKSIPVTIGEYPAEQPEASATKQSMENLGFTVSDITPALRSRYDIGDDETGIVVINVNQGSPAFQAGLREGDLILKIDRKPVASTDEFNDIIKDVEVGQPIALYLKRGDQKLFAAFSVSPQN